MHFKFKKKYVTRTFVLLILVFIAPSFALAFPPGNADPGRETDMGMAIEQHHRSPYALWRNPEIIQDLQLSDDQVEQFKKADFTFRENMLNLKAQIDNLHLQMEKAFSTEPVDEAAIVQLAQKIADLKGKLFVQAIASRLAFEKLLTTDQLKKLKVGFSHLHPMKGNVPFGMGHSMEQDGGRLTDKNRMQPNS